MDRVLEGRRLLILDDDYLVAIDVQAMVEDLGAIVIGPVGRLEQARELARTEPLEGAILDVNLNQATTSYPLARELLARGIVVVFLTGYEADSIDAEFRDIPRIAKPCDPRQVERLFESAFG
jgi:DNA-binding response OmpR family regulator